MQLNFQDFNLLNSFNLINTLYYKKTQIKINFIKNYT